MAKAVSFVQESLLCYNANEEDNLGLLHMIPAEQYDVKSPVFYVIFRTFDLYFSYKLFKIDCHRIGKVQVQLRIEEI